jgi:hypothetical protein
MLDVRRLPVIAATVFALGAILPIQAYAFDLSGAWATDPELCSRVFTKTAKGVTFAELSDLYGSGFIINGDKVRGKAARCTITSRKQDGDTLSLFASCASSIMNQNVEFRLKNVDDNKITRLFPDMEGMQLTYSRCKL